MNEKQALQRACLHSRRVFDDYLFCFITKQPWNSQKIVLFLFCTRFAVSSLLPLSHSLSSSLDHHCSLSHSKHSASSSLFVYISSSTIICCTISLHRNQTHELNCFHISLSHFVMLLSLLSIYQSAYQSYYYCYWSTTVLFISNERSCGAGECSKLWMW